jgi:DNA replication protein DnaC
MKKTHIITSNKSFETWTEMMGDEIMTTVLLDRLMHHVQIFNLDGNSQLKQKEEVIKP